MVRRPLWNAVRSFVVPACLVLGAGCVHQQNRALGWYAEEADVSQPHDGDRAASVAGRRGSLLLWSWDCWMTYPVRASRLIVSPGPVTIRVVCEVDGVTEALFSETLAFEAEPGGRYDAGSALSGCLVVRDLRDRRRVARSEGCAAEVGPAPGGAQ